MNHVAIIQIVQLMFPLISNILLSCTADLQDKPKISSKGADLHLISGNGGNIVLEHSKEGKIFFGTQEVVSCFM